MYYIQEPNRREAVKIYVYLKRTQLELIKKKKKNYFTPNYTPVCYQSHFEYKISKYN